MGYSGAQFDPEKVDLFFESNAGKLQIIENGVALSNSLSYNVTMKKKSWDYREK